MNSQESRHQRFPSSFWGSEKRISQRLESNLILKKAMKNVTTEDTHGNGLHIAAIHVFAIEKRYN